MGRCYSGMIDGKFWFGVQSSDAADRFGGEKHGPQYVEYSFYEEDLPKIKEELILIEQTLGDALQKLNNFFDKVDGYNDKIMMENGVLDVWNKHQKDYADYILGVKIRDCVEDEGVCNFNAEY